MKNKNKMLFSQIYLMQHKNDFKIKEYYKINLSKNCRPKNSKHYSESSKNCCLETILGNRILNRQS